MVVSGRYVQYFSKRARWCRFLQPRGRVSSPLSFAIFWQDVAVFEGLATKRSRFVNVELTQNINTILYDCTLSNLQINMLTHLHECELQSINFLKCIFFNSRMHSIYIQYTSINKLSKEGAVLVNIIYSNCVRSIQASKEGVLLAE